MLPDLVPDLLDDEVPLGGMLGVTRRCYSLTGCSDKRFSALLSQSALKPKRELEAFCLVEK